MLNIQQVLVFFNNNLFIKELSGGFLLSTCLNLIDYCSESPAYVFKSFTAISHKLICILIQAHYDCTDNLSLLKPKEIMKMIWWHNEPIYMEDMLTSSLCWNLTMGTVFIPHATAIFSTNCPKKRKDGKTNNNKPPTYAKLRAWTGSFLEEFQWQFFIAARVTVQLSHWPWGKIEAEIQEANTGAKWLICLSR